jgi:hypothetical protein
MNRQEIEEMAAAKMVAKVKNKSVLSPTMPKGTVLHKSAVEVVVEIVLMEMEGERLRIQAICEGHGHGGGEMKCEGCGDKVFETLYKKIDPEPQPSDGPEYHANHKAWKERQRKE